MNAQQKQRMDSFMRMRSFPNVHPGAIGEYADISAERSGLQARSERQS
jgi:hypothetical protein